MAIGSSTSSPSLSSLSLGQGSGGSGSADIPLGLRGSVSLGSGLRTGVTVVNRAIQTAAELDEARQIAREAFAEQARLEQEAAAAEQAARSETQRAEPGEAAALPPETEDAATQRTIEAAVVAGEAGDTPPRGAFLDVTI